MELKSILRQVPDFPKPGINFIDITTLLLRPDAFEKTVQDLMEPYQGQIVDKVVAIESRGFIFAAPMALRMKAGLVLVRKPNKLPAETYSHTYELEYGSDTIEIHKDAVHPGERVIIVDDLLATGGTALAAVELLKQFDCQIFGASFVVELSFLNARAKFSQVPVHSLVTYESE